MIKSFYEEIIYSLHLWKSNTEKDKKNQIKIIVLINCNSENNTSILKHKLFILKPLQFSVVLILK